MATLITNQKTRIKCKSIAEARELLNTRRDCSAGHIEYDDPQDFVECPIRAYRKPTGEEVPVFARNRG